MYVRHSCELSHCSVSRTWCVRELPTSSLTARWLFVIIIKNKADIFGSSSWSFCCALISNHKRNDLKVYSMTLGSRLEKQATSENSSQMLMFLVTVCVSHWTERICLWAFHLFPAPHLLSPPRPVPGWADSLIHGNISSYFPSVDNENHQQSGPLQDASHRVK